MIPIVCRLSFLASIVAGYLLASVTPSEHPIASERIPAPWLPGTVPNPMKDPSTCQMTTPTFLCDPDGVMTADQKKRIVESLSQMFHDPDNTVTHHQVVCNGEKSGTIEVAVAIIHKMDLTNYQDTFHPTDDEDDDPVVLQAIKDFAMTLHDDWGVGSTTSCGGTGILLLLSIQDRACFISTGAAWNEVLPDWRLDKVLDGMKPHLRQLHYDTAIVDAFRHVQRYMDEGPPTFSEKCRHVLDQGFGILLFFLIVVGFTRVASRVQHRSRAEYAAVSSQLNEIERSRALALQGRYECTSCPICLERFQSINSSTSNENETTSSDEQESTGRERLVTDSPIGSDGLPVKLLRCGHAFDETCWTEWIANGKGNPTLCPICRLDVGRSPESQGDVPVRRGHVTPVSAGALNTAVATSQPDAVESRVVVNHQREMRFRLHQLRVHYPRYIRQSNLDLWTRNGYDGPIARDPEFLRSNPDRTTSGFSSKNAGFGSSFGGGRSSGGRGGRW